MSTTNTFEQMVMSKCDTFVDFQLWPVRQTLDPAAWLSNFTAPEMAYAITLLNSFIYYPKPFIVDLLCHSFRDLSCEVTAQSTTYGDAKHRWTGFQKALVVSHVTGEQPNDTDSGHAMVRLVRQHAGIDQQQILNAEAVLPNLASSNGRTVVFVDDFVGSGQQFITHWQRSYQTGGGAFSFSGIEAMGRGHQFYYIPVVASAYGVSRIATACPTVRVRPAHQIDDQYNCLSPTCPFWPQHLRANVVSTLKNASDRAGIPDTDWQGFHQLGLAFAFEHSTPDATLPIFHWNRNGWKPLVTRT